MQISEHQKPLNSGYGSRTDAAEIMDGVDLSGKTAIVTGGYSGIGLETTRVLAAAGAEVVVPVRSLEKAREAFAEIDGAVKTAPLDLADLKSVRKFADDFLSDHDKLHLLINNAGIMACPEARVGPGWESQFGINHLGHFVLTTALASALENADGARVVSLSSLAHRRSGIRFDDIHFEKDPYEKWEAYGQAKSANALFAVELDRRMKDKGVRAFSVHPGGIVTPLQRHLQQEEMVGLGWFDENGEITEFAKDFFKTVPQGAATTVWCAVSPQLDGMGGLYCEDCDVAKVTTKDDPMLFLEVRPHAVDREVAKRLWDVSEKMVAA